MSEVYFKSYGKKKNIHQCHLVSRGYTDMTLNTVIAGQMLKDM